MMGLIREPWSPCDSISGLFRSVMIPVFFKWFCECLISMDEHDRTEKTRKTANTKKTTVVSNIRGQ